MDFTYTLRVKLQRQKQPPFYGPGISELLMRVQEFGSLQTAAASMEMSYSKAWKITCRAEKALGFALLERRAGGAGGGFSRLTDQGRLFLEQYQMFCKELEQEADRLFLQHFGKEFGSEDRKDKGSESLHSGEQNDGKEQEI